MINRAIVPALAVIQHLQLRLSAASDNKGIQFKINAQPNWKGTIGLRCNHVFCESIPAYIKGLIHELSVHRAFPLLEHVSISKAFDTDPTTSRKRPIPWKRTLFITLHPGRELYEKLSQELSSSIENYMELEHIIGALDALREEDSDDDAP